MTVLENTAAEIGPQLTKRTDDGIICGMMLECIDRHLEAIMQDEYIIIIPLLSFIIVLPILYQN